MGYYNMDSEFDYKNTAKEIQQEAPLVVKTNTPSDKPKFSTEITNDERIQMLKKKLDYIKGNGGMNEMFKQNRFSAKVGLIAAGVGFLYAWRTKKSLFWWSLGAGIGGLVVGNLLKDKMSYGTTASKTVKEKEEVEP